MSKTKTTALTSGKQRLVFDNGRVVDFLLENGNVKVWSSDFDSAELMSTDTFADYIQDVSTLNLDTCERCGMRGGKT